MPASGLIDADPFILTLTLDPAAQMHFDALRSAHFPPDRLFVGAHVTLFHALPRDIGMDNMAREAAAEQPFPVQVCGLRFLGRGVAFALASDRLTALRDRLCRLWLDRLTPQDRQPWRPHITIQNKVEPATAKGLHVALASSFMPYAVTATGLDLWIYRGGPWQAAGSFPFYEDQGMIASG